MAPRGGKCVRRYTLPRREESDVYYFHVGWSSRSLVAEQAEVTGTRRTSHHLGFVSGMLSGEVFPKEYQTGEGDGTYELEAREHVSRRVRHQIRTSTKVFEVLSGSSRRGVGARVEAGNAAARVKLVSVSSGEMHSSRRS